MPILTIELSDEAAEWIKDLADSGEVPGESACLDFLIRRQIEPAGG